MRNMRMMTHGGGFFSDTFADCKQGFFMRIKKIKFRLPPTSSKINLRRAVNAERASERLLQAKAHDTLNKNNISFLQTGGFQSVPVRCAVSMYQTDAKYSYVQT
uniref:Uncharacterized protein n=1 Tax=Cacopsylla melanoneura TaxID=428564 RepID=A0A8D9B9L6_9HEMI